MFFSSYFCFPLSNVVLCCCCCFATHIYQIEVWIHLNRYMIFTNGYICIHLLLNRFPHVLCEDSYRDPSLLYIESDLRTFCWQPSASHTWNTPVLIYIVTVSTDFSTLILTLKWDPTNLFRKSVVSPVLPTKKLRKRRHKFLVKVHTQRIKRAKIQTKYGILLLHYEVLCKFKCTCPSSTPY